MKAPSAEDIVLKIWHSKDGPVSDKPPARVCYNLVKYNLTKLTTTNLVVKRSTSLAVKRFISLAVKRSTSLAVHELSSQAVHKLIGQAAHERSRHPAVNPISAGSHGLW